MHCETCNDEKTVERDCVCHGRTVGYDCPKCGNCGVLVVPCPECREDAYDPPEPEWEPDDDERISYGEKWDL